MNTQIQDTFGGGWGAFLGGVQDTVSTGFDLATKWEAYRATKDQDKQQQQMIETPTTDYNPAITQNGQATAPTGKEASLTIDKNLLITGGLIVVGGAVLVALLKN